MKVPRSLTAIAVVLAVTACQSATATPSPTLPSDSVAPATPSAGASAATAAVPTASPTAGLDFSNPYMAITGPMEVVYDWSSQRCSPNDYPDMPIRPFRDADGKVVVNRSGADNRNFVGPTLDAIQPACDVTLQSALDPDASHFNYKTWLQAVYTEDGRKVFAVLHDEHNCGDFGEQNCAYWNLAYATSADGGKTYQVPKAPANYLAGTPHKYEPGAGMYGLLTGSNIVKGPDGYYYMFALNKEYKQQEQHTCLLRTDDLTDPSAWRAWDGSGFGMTLPSPYAADVDPAAHDCPAVDTDIHQLDGMAESLIYDTYLQRYVAVSLNVDWVGNATVWGIDYAFSGDLIHWDNRKVLVPMELSAHTGPGGPDGAGYAVLLDPTSTSRNFETAGQKAYIYFSRFNNVSGISPADVDLVRFPVEFFATRQAAVAADVRTNVSLTATAAGSGESLAGSVTDENGRPIAGAKVDLNWSPDDQTGLVHDYTVTTTVPPGASSADVGLRVNTECGCTAGNAADLYVYDFTYSQSDGKNRVPNPAFASGMNGYGSWGNGKVQLLKSDHGSGTMLHVTATKDQSVGLNSSSFPVTPGSTLTFTVRARVVPGSFWTGFFGLFFSGSGREPLRLTIPFTTPQTAIGTATTDASGRYEFTWKDVPASPHHVQAAVAGPAGYWPSTSDGSTLTIP